jgi:hypothetical protein
MNLSCINCGKTVIPCPQPWKQKKYCSDRCGVQTRNRLSCERKRRAAGVPKRIFYTKEELRERELNAARVCAERKRRLAGVPPKVLLTDEQRAKNKNKRLAQLQTYYEANPELRKRTRRNSATRKRIAMLLNVDIKVVPKELLKTQLLVNDVIRYAKENK